MPILTINGIDYSKYVTPVVKGASLEGKHYTKKPKRIFSCTSRKRFIKLLMSARIPRNTAIKIADSFITGESWQFRLWYFRVIVNEWRKVYDA